MKKLRTCILNCGKPEGHGFFPSDKEISPVIRANHRGNRRDMAEKTPAGGRSTVVNARLPRRSKWSGAAGCFPFSVAANQDIFSTRRSTIFGSRQSSVTTFAR